MKTPIRFLAATVGVAALAAVAAVAAFGASGQTTLQANLQPVPTNQVNGSGTATVTVSGNTLHVTIHATGLDRTSPNGLPAHAQHIHIGGSHTCPTASAATNHNGHQAISVTDAAPDYGAIMVSLTTSGDTSPKSALALKRFPTTPNGSEDYSRTIQVSSSVASQVANGQGVIVIHGIDYLHNGSYKDLGKADVDPSLPQEGTAPALCGRLLASQMSGGMPSGGVSTGGGSTAGFQHEGLLALGLLLLLGAAGAGALGRRALRRDR